MEENAEMSARVKLLRLGVMAWHGETLGQGATVGPLSREGGRRPVGADQRHSDTSLLATTARLSAIMHVHQRLAC